MSRGSGFSHASGLAYVPYDNYPALLHRGETVLNAGDTGSLLTELRKLTASSGTATGGEIVINITETIDGAILARNQYKHTLREGTLRGGSLVEVSG